MLTMEYNTKPLLKHFKFFLFCGPLLMVLAFLGIEQLLRQAPATLDGALRKHAANR